MKPKTSLDFAISITIIMIIINQSIIIPPPAPRRTSISISSSSSPPTTPPIIILVIIIIIVLAITIRILIPASSRRRGSSSPNMTPTPFLIFPMITTTANTQKPTDFLLRLLHKTLSTLSRPRPAGTIPSAASSSPAFKRLLTHILRHAVPLLSLLILLFQCSSAQRTDR